MTLTNDETSAEPAVDGRIYAAVIDVFREAQDVTHETVAERAGVSLPALRLRWPAAADLAMEALVAGCFPTPPDPGDLGLREELIVIISRLLSEQILHRDLVQALAARLPVDPELNRAYRRQVILPRNEVGRRILGRAVLRGEVDPEVDPDLVFSVVPAYLAYRTVLLDPVSDPGAAARLADALVLPLLRRCRPL
ncbi:TetR/AcrR family transcriptional regulator C-terminal ligand-binding domain-containing protein [Actinocorallia sp. API 0066]|uniref:TetR-like C-terminal domain-containing protein n=1 Tax=Actinocorallia sp. API 0066 TaxID=2896846 RepID=UPI001E34BE2A|nr:TetR-like C-terminal domain-containing protein [Actinocorallia sp. API 0066]MCD0450734.1 TetR/AcrR family transcriptional regulator C-terminal ligand-binding domain-containing protein [Actinocorallia sp. API 0066]